MGVTIFSAIAALTIAAYVLDRVTSENGLQTSIGVTPELSSGSNQTANADSAMEGNHNSSENRGDAFVTKVTFPDGSTLPITFRPRRSPNVPAAPFGRHIEGLENLALIGDSFASFSLYEITQYCRDAFVTQGDLETAKKQLRNTNMLQLPTWSQPMPLDDPSQVDSFAQDLDEQYLNCDGVSNDVRMEGDRWLRLSADQGYSVASIILGSASSSIDEQIELFTVAWRAGDAGGLMGLSHALQQQYSSGAAPQNKLGAYAALLAYTSILEKAYENHGPIARRQLGRIQSELANAALALKEDEKLEAIGLARKHLVNNPNCCLAL